MTLRPRIILFCLILLGGCRDMRAAPATFNVRDYGAQGDRTTNNQRALQAALDACAASGGGTVLVPAGDYFSGPLRLASGVTLHLAAGATLWASTNREDYASPGSSAHFLRADGARGIALTGKGTINGQVTADYGERWGVPEKPAFRTGILLFTNCREVTVRDVTILNSDAWTLHFRRCENLTIEDVTIRNNYRRLNSDGIDPNSCRNVRIARCRIVAGDDCIVLKSTEPYPCENVTVTDCVLESAASALKLGTESQGDFRNIRFANCVISNSPTGIGLYLKDGATMEKIVFTNIVIGSSQTGFRVVTPVFLDIERRHPDSKVGRIRDVTFDRLDITSGSGILAQGMPESLLERVTFRHLRFRVPQADDYAKRSKPVGGRRTTRDERDSKFARLPSYFTVAYARDLTVEDVSVEIAEPAFRQFDRAALSGRHLEGGVIRNVRRSPGAAAGKAPVLDLQESRGLTVAQGDGLEFIDTSFENASPVWYESTPDGTILVHLLYDRERSSPNRAAGHFHFLLQAKTGSKLRLEFRNLDNVWNGRPGSVARELKVAFVSQDGRNWRPLPLESLPENRVQLQVEMPGPRLYVARLEPYRLSDLDRLLASIRHHPLVQITPIGRTVAGRELEMVRIGMESAPYRVFVRARSHPWESGGNWVAQGLINRLLQGDEMAKQYLEHYCLYVLPMANKDGVVRGMTRFNLQGKDLNRDWNKPADLELAPENHALEKWLERMIETGRRPHLAVELHNDGGGLLHISRPRVPDLNRHLERMKTLEELLCRHTWFTEGSTGGSYSNSGTLGDGWLERYGIDAVVHELNCYWIAGLKDYPSAWHWEEYGAKLATVFDEYFAQVKP